MAKTNPGGAEGLPTTDKGARKPRASDVHTEFPCVFCKCEDAVIHFESSGIVVTCETCKGSFRFAGSVVRKPDAAHLEDKPHTMHELGLFDNGKKGADGKAKWRQLKGLDGEAPPDEEAAE